MNSLLQNITHAIGWSMAHSIWQGALIYGIICIVYLLLPKLAPKYKYNVALLGQATLFLSFVITFSHYVDFSIPSQSNAIHADNILFAWSQTSSYSAIKALELLFPWLSSLYVVGIFIQLILFSSSLSKLHYLKTQGLAATPIIWEESFQRICTDLHIKKAVQFYLSEKISVPLTIGHLKPIILFPISFVNNLEVEQVESILVHELAHIKRHDYLLNLFKVFMETVLFFNPFIWLLSRHIEMEREHACDDVVVNWTPSSIAYAQALVSIETLKNSVTPIHAMAAVGKKYHLLHRIQRITNMEKHYIHAKQHLIALAVCSLALITVAWVSPATKSTPIVIQEAKVQPSLEVPVTTDQTFALPLEQVYPPLSPDTVKSPLPAEPKKPQEPKQAKAIEANVKKIEDYSNSPEWKNKMTEIETQTRKIADYYNSPEWKNKMAEIKAETNKIEQYYDSPAWKNKIADIETQARKIADYHNSPEWISKMAEIKAKTSKIEQYYDSPAWKNKIADIETQARKVADYYNSPEWKNKMTEIEAKAKKMVKDYSPE